MDNFFVSRAEADGEVSLLGGIQLAMDVLMVPLFFQHMTRWSLLEVVLVSASVDDCRRGVVSVVGGQRGVVLRVVGGLSGGISSGRALQNLGLGMR